MIRYYIIVDGRVQGVGFRFFCTMNARTLDLTGWVRNMDNGMVEMEVQGEENSIEKFIKNIKKLCTKKFTKRAKTSVILIF